MKNTHLIFMLEKEVKFKTNTQEIHREDEKFNIIFENFIKQNSQDKTIKIIKNMQDFHLFQLIFKKGRFVKGFVLDKLMI